MTGRGPRLSCSAANDEHGYGQLQPQPTDLELLRRARNGDGRAFHALVDRYARPMFGLAYSLLGNAADAEDVVQETFTGAFKGLSKFQERSSVKTWLSRILVNQAAMFQRDKRAKRTEALDAAGYLADDPSKVVGAGGGASGGGGSAMAGVDARLDLQATLRTLSDEHHQVLALRELQQLSYEEIAAVLDVPRGTVESRLHRARAELRKRLGSYLD